MLMKLDFGSNIPIYLQIRNQVVLGIAEGRLKPGERLPTIRALAEECGVNMMTVNKSYSLLKQDGYIIADRRNGATVAVRDGAQTNSVGAGTRETLRLIAAEAKFAGLDRESWMALCGEIYDTWEV